MWKMFQVHELVIFYTESNTKKNCQENIYIFHKSIQIESSVS